MNELANVVPGQRPGNLGHASLPGSIVHVDGRLIAAKFDARDETELIVRGFHRLRVIQVERLTRWVEPKARPSIVIGTSTMPRFESPLFPLARCPTHRRVLQPGARGTDTEHAQVVRSDRQGLRWKSGVRSLARLKRRDFSRPRRSSVERDKEGDDFVHLRWEENKEGDTVHGARLTIETDAGVSISISSP